MKKRGSTDGNGRRDQGAEEYSPGPATATFARGCTPPAPGPDRITSRQVVEDPPPGAPSEPEGPVTIDALLFVRRLAAPLLIQAGLEDAVDDAPTTAQCRVRLSRGRQGYLDMECRSLHSAPSTCLDRLSKTPDRTRSENAHGDVPGTGYGADCNSVIKCGFESHHPLQIPKKAVRVKDLFDPGKQSWRCSGLKHRKAPFESEAWDHTMHL